MSQDEVQLKTAFLIESGGIMFSFSDDQKASEYQKKVPGSVIYSKMSRRKVYLLPPANLVSIRAGQDEPYLVFIFKHPAAAKAWKKLSVLGQIKENRVWIKQYWDEDELDEALGISSRSRGLAGRVDDAVQRVVKKIDRGAKDARGSRD